MPNYLEDLAKGLLRASEGLQALTVAVQEIATGLAQSVTATAGAHDEWKDLNETVHRLETLIMDQQVKHDEQTRALQQEIREVRALLNGKAPE